jgi:hypothetical protein
MRSLRDRAALVLIPGGIGFASTPGYRYANLPGSQAGHILTGWHGLCSAGIDRTLHNMRTNKENIEENSGLFRLRAGAADEEDGGEGSVIAPQDWDEHFRK